LTDGPYSDILGRHADQGGAVVKFVRFGDSGAERPGVLLDDDTIGDLSSIVGDLGPTTLHDLPGIVERVGDGSGLPTVAVADVRLGSPVARPHKIIAIGLNYADHAAESGMDVPTEPVVFHKATSSLSGPYDDVVMYPDFPKVDWEVELALVVGATAKRLPDETAADEAIVAYTLANDVSERSYQIERGGQWTKGKSADTFSPLGPWLVTRDEVPDPRDLRLWTRVNGVTKQDGSSSQLVFGPAHIVWYLSQFMTLEPGDVILTGTPPGVALATGEYLQDGDVVEVGIPGLGSQRQVFRRVE